MSKGFKNFLKVFIPLVITGLLVWYMSTIIDFKVVWSNVTTANPYWIILGLLISVLAHWSRAYRWNLLMEPLDIKPKVRNTFIAVMVAYFGNIFIPRLGEVARCIVLNRIDRVPFNAAFGTVVAERAFDFLCLLMLIGLSFVLEFERFKVFFSEMVFGKKEAAAEPGMNNIYLIILGVLIIGLIIGVFAFRKRIFISPAFIKFRDFGKGILEGALSIRKLKRKWAFIFHTLLIWGCYYLMTFLVFFSLPSTSGLGPLAGLVILIVGGLGMSAPSSGGIGPFHIMVAGALQLFYGLEKSDGYAFASILHGSQFLALLVVGGICTAIAYRLSRKINSEHLKYDQSEDRQ